MAESKLRVTISGDERGLKTATSEANKDLGKTGEAHKAMSGAAKLAWGLVGGGALEGAKMILEAGMKGQEAQDHLSQAFRVTGIAGGKWVTDAEKQGQKYGIVASKIDEALAQGVRSLGNKEKAQKALQLAENISAATGKPLADTMMAVTKAYEGQLRPLKMLGIDLPVAAGGALKVQKAQEKLFIAETNLNAAMKLHSSNAKDETKIRALQAADLLKVQTAQNNLSTVQSAGGGIIDALSKKYKGSAGDASKTFEGKVKSLHAWFGNLTETVGQKVIPVLMTWGDWLGNHKPVLIAFGVLVGVTLVGAFASWAASIIATNIALLANPVVLVTVAIIAIGVAIYAAYKKFGWFHTAVDAVWQALQTGFHWVQQNWPLLLAILTGPFGLAVLAITENWGTITGFFQSLPGKLVGFLSTVASGIAWPFVSAWNIISTPLGSLYNFFKNLPGNIVGFIQGIPGELLGMAGDMLTAGTTLGGKILSGLISGIAGAAGKVADIAKGLFNGFVGFVNVHLIDPIRDFKVFGSKVFHSLPEIPTLHSGGIFNSGRGEGLALLEDGERVQTKAQQRASDGGSSHVVINMPAGVDPAAVVRAQQKYNRRNGVTAA